MLVSQFRFSVNIFQLSFLPFLKLYLLQYLLWVLHPELSQSEYYAQEQKSGQTVPSISCLTITSAKLEPAGWCFNVAQFEHIVGVNL